LAEQKEKNQSISRSRGKATFVGGKVRQQRKERTFY